MRSASGGIFAAVADYIIRNGGYVVGAIMDGVTVKYVITDKLEDIANMQGSKYQQADSTGIYKLVKEKISAGSVVFFSGVPCQVAGLYSLLGKLGHSDLLLTADLVCTGFPTSLLLKRFMDNINYPYSKISYRNKSKGWINSDGRFVTVNALALTVTNRPGEIIDYGRNNFVYNGYFCGHTLRYSCSNCRFPFLNRKADLTLADFWGEKHFPEEHYKGISCVVAHSDAGRKLLTAADITFHEVEWADFIPFNKMVYSKMPYLKIHPARRLLAWNFSHLSFTCLEKIYGGKIKKTNIVWLPYKIFNFIIWKISEKRRKIYNKNFLKKIRNEE
jgi:hypothetical protein